MTYGRILTRWVGGPSSPGLTVMNVRYTSGAIGTSVTAVRTFWNSLAGFLPDEYVLTVDPFVELHEESDGSLTGSISAASPPAAVSGTMTAGWAAGVGIRVNWTTGAIVNGHRVAGRTFIVPVKTSAYANDGTIEGGDLATVQTAVNTLLAALTTATTPLVVYTKATTAGAGAITDVVSGAPADQVAVLAGRRRP